MWCGFWAGPMMDFARGRGRDQSGRKISTVWSWAMVPTQYIVSHLQLPYPVHWTMCIAWHQGVHAMPHCVASGELGISSTHPEL